MEPYYQDESVTIYHADCRDVLPTLAPVDLVLTDPPYGLKENAYRVASRTKLAAPTDYGSFEWDAAPPSKEEIAQVVAAGKSSIVWGGNYFHLSPSRGWLVWDKINGENNFADCELAWTNLPMSVRLFRFLWNGMLRDGEQRGVKRVHPAQKPVELMRWCISLAGHPASILDPYLGSGTTLRAAKDFGITAIGIDREERYCEIAAKRMSQLAMAIG